ncbi:MAG: hypothetical protein NTW29_11915 [Bacteroidetes bacterium]|nr:hypothetical protein [Bacteroidota bacterium]
MSVRYYILLLITVGSLSCGLSFEQNYYERISGMKFPDGIRVIETFDNGEYLTTTTLQTDSSELVTFLNKYHLGQLKNFNANQYLGKTYLKKHLPDFHNLTNLYCKTGSNGKNSWIYIIDIERKLLWAEIQYPDWGGH